MFSKKVLKVRFSTFSLLVKELLLQNITGSTSLHYIIIMKKLPPFSGHVLYFSYKLLVLTLEWLVGNSITWTVQERINDHHNNFFGLQIYEYTFFSLPGMHLIPCDFNFAAESSTTVTFDPIFCLHLFLNAVYLIKWKYSWNPLSFLWEKTVVRKRGSPCLKERVMWPFKLSNYSVHWDITVWEGFSVYLFQKLISHISCAEETEERSSISCMSIWWASVLSDKWCWLHLGTLTETISALRLAQQLWWQMCGWRLFVRLESL